MPSHSGSERILLTRPGGSQVREFLKAHQLEKFFDDITGHGVTEAGEHQLNIGSLEKLSKVKEADLLTLNFSNPTLQGCHVQIVGHHADLPQ